MTETQVDRDTINEKKKGEIIIIIFTTVHSLRILCRNNYRRKIVREKK